MLRNKCSRLRHERGRSVVEVRAFGTTTARLLEKLKTCRQLKVTARCCDRVGQDHGPICYACRLSSHARSSCPRL